MTNDSRVVFETIAKLAGLCVIFDPDYVSRRVTAELPGVTLEQALDAVSFETKAFWKPLTSTVIEIAPDNPQKRKDIEDEQVATFYVANSLTPQDLTEMVNGLRQLLDLHRIQQVNAQNAIIVRDTPDKLDLAAKVIADMDKAKPEVLLARAGAFGESRPFAATGNFAVAECVAGVQSALLGAICEYGLHQQFEFVYHRYEPAFDHAE